MPTKKQNTDPTQPTGDNVDQIREILFGSHMRAVDDRFETVEERLSKESKALKKALENRIKELEKMLGAYSDKAGDEINRESAERDAQLGKVSDSLAAFRIDAENQLAKMQSDFNAEIKQVRQELTAAQKSLMGDLESLRKAHDKSLDKLVEDKVGRGELAGFLSDIAGRLMPTTKKTGK
jgi:uncharacterized protein YicC (UPF0701 family)